jgi:hypothetical protein
MTPATRAQLQIHFCVMLWGFTAILGKLITLTALPLVWWRMLLFTASLVQVPAALRSLRKISARQNRVPCGHAPPSAIPDASLPSA